MKPSFKIIATISLILFFSGCASLVKTNSIRSSDEEIFSSAVKNNDVEAFKKAASGYTEIKAPDLNHYLQMTFQNLGSCPSGMQKYLISKGARPTEKSESYRVQRATSVNILTLEVSEEKLDGYRESNLSAAFDSKCDDVKKVIYESSDSENFAKFIENNNQIWTSRASSENKDIEKKIQALDHFLKSRCQSDPSYCQPRVRLAAVIERRGDQLRSVAHENQIEKEAEEDAAKAERDEAFSKTPDGVLRDTCLNIQAVKRLNKDLATQDEITKKSGVINLSAKHHLGSMVITQEGNNKEMMAKYKKMTGKDMPLFRCKEFKEAPASND